LTEESEGYYEDYADQPIQHLGRALAEGFAYQGNPSPHKGGTPRGEPSAHLPPSAFVSFLQNHDQIGNRAFGERLSHLISPERLALARSIFLLSPQIPLLFMGEEWAASTPFQFFVDFENEPDLAKAVREGRRGEFKRFKAFADPEVSQRIPDPTERATFERSRVNWSEVGQSPHRDVLSDTRNLLDLRRAEITPLLKSDFHGSRHTASPDKALDVTWAFAAGTLRLLVNFGDRAANKSIDESARVIWSSPGLAPSGTSVQLLPWTGMMVKEASA
jgi:maltooligosyltrehalose trehalohydrolase